MIRDALVERVQRPGEDPFLWRRLSKQSQARSELHRINVAEYRCGAAVRVSEESIDALDESGTEHRVGKVACRLLEVSETVVTCHLAAPEISQLGQDEPDPVRSLPSGAKFRKCLRVLAILGAYESIQWFGRCTHGGLDGW